MSTDYSAHKQFLLENFNNLKEPGVPDHWTEKLFFIAEPDLELEVLTTISPEKSDIVKIWKRKDKKEFRYWSVSHLFQMNWNIPDGLNYLNKQP